MKKQKIKQISEAEKIEFYKKYNDKEFKKSLEEIHYKHARFGLLSIKIFFFIGLIGMLFSPWFVFAFLPGFVIPIVSLSVGNLKQKQAVESLTKNISYEDFIQMIKNEDFQKIAQELQKKENEENNIIKPLKSSITKKNTSVEKICENANDNDLTI